MQLRNKTRSSSKVGYLVKAVSGGFEYAGVGDNPIGVVTKSVPSGAMCEIQTSGEALVYVNRVVAEGNDLRLTVANEGGNAGIAQPVGTATVYTSIGTALQKGSGLIKVALNLASAGVVGGSGGDIPAGGSTGQILTKLSASDYHVGWSAAPASYTSWGIVDGIYTRDVIDGDAIEFVNGGDIQIQYDGYAGGVHTITFTYTGTPGTMSQWYLNADTDSPRQIQNNAEVTILGGTYINTGEVTYNSTDLWWEMTIDIDTTALDGRYYTQTVADATFATQAWVSANYDNYSSWGIVDGIYTRDVISGDAIEFANGGDIQIQYDGYAGGVHTITFTYTGTPGTMDRWYFNTDHVDSPKSIQNNAEVYLIGGTGIDLSEVTYNSTDLRWEMTIANTAVSPWTTDTNGITYSGGNVGIGIASSATEELVVSAATDAIIRINSTKDGTWVDGDILGALEFYGSDASGGGAGVKAYMKAVEYSTFGAAFDLEFGTCDGTNPVATRMTIKYDGDIGIGTDTPGYSVDILDDTEAILRIRSIADAAIIIEADTDNATESHNPYILFKQDNSGVTGNIGLTQTGYDATYSALTDGLDNSFTMHSPSGTYPMQFATNSNVRMTIEPGGHIGIGTNNPAQLLGDGGRVLHIAAPSTGNDNPEIVLERTTVGDTAVGSLRITDAQTFAFGIKVGTGTPTTIMTLDASSVSITGALYATGEVESYDTSDIRLKANHHEISYKRSSQLLDVNVIEFDHIIHERHEIGLIAQEIKEIFPEVVKENDQGYLMLDYGRLVAPMLQIIQNQERRINDLERRFHVYK